MALTIHRAFKLTRLVDSVHDNPMELTIGGTGPGRVTVHLEDRDAGTVTNTLELDLAELHAALAVVAVPRNYYIED